MRLKAHRTSMIYPSRHSMASIKKLQIVETSNSPHFL